MSAVSITAASVLKGAGSLVSEGVAGEAITAGQVLYLDSSTITLKLADSDASGKDVGIGFALHGALAGQPIAYLTSGPYTPGGTLTAGTFYYVSPTAGGICLIADIASPSKPCIVGYASTTTVLQVGFVATGVAL